MSQRNGYTISTDPARLDVDAIWLFVAPYWANQRNKETVEKSLHSLNFGMYLGAMLGWRGDYRSRHLAYLCDVYILEEHRGAGWESG